MSGSAGSMPTSTRAPASSAMPWPGPSSYARRGSDGHRARWHLGHHRQRPPVDAGQPGPPAPRRRGHALPRVRARAPRGAWHERLVRHLDGRAGGRLPRGRLADHGELGLAAGHPGARLASPRDGRGDARGAGGAPGGQPQREPRLEVPRLVRRATATSTCASTGPSPVDLDEAMRRPTPSVSCRATRAPSGRRRSPTSWAATTPATTAISGRSSTATISGAASRPRASAARSSAPPTAARSSSPGSSRDAEALVEAFLGRPSTNEAFLRRTGIGAVSDATTEPSAT